MTQKIIKQDVLNSLKNNLNENNIEDLINELKRKSLFEIDVQIYKKDYMCFVAVINLLKQNIKNEGFGRTEYDALKTALINLFDQLLENEKFVSSVRDSLKVFLRKNKNTTTNKKCENIFKMSKDNAVNTANIMEKERQIKNIFIINEDEKAFRIVKEQSFVLLSNNQNVITLERLNENLKENNLITLELEKLIIDMMNNNKKIIQILERESNAETFPDYFKCPVSWEKMENPVISMEGHSYEKWAIEKWLCTQQTSPITGLVLNNHTLISNYNFKSAIDDFEKRQLKFKRHKIDLQKFLTKCEYDLNDLKKYFSKDLLSLTI